MDLELLPRSSLISQIERVFLSLIINAAEAMEGTGACDYNPMDHITTWRSMCRILDRYFTREHQEDLRSILTTKETARRGLPAISYGIVEEHLVN
jgi:hypothetical protein